MDLISVIIPVYNTEKYLERCVTSVINQSYKEIEIILVDDGSTDSSGKICDEFMEREPRMRVIHQKNSGAGLARNAALSIAQGDFVFFVDSDDYVFNDIIYKMYVAATTYQADLVCCGYESGHKEEYENRKIEVWNGYEACQRMFIRRGIDSNTVCKLYKKDILQGIQYLSTPYEDVPITYQILLRCGKVASLGEGGYYIEKRPTSVTRKSFSHDHLLYVSLTKLVMSKIAEEYADLLPYAQAFYYHAIIETSEKAELSGKETSIAMDAYKEIQKIFRDNFRKIISNPYIRARKKIICILIKLNIYKLCYKIVNWKLMNSQEIKA